MDENKELLHDSISEVIADISTPTEQREQQTTHVAPVADAAPAADAPKPELTKEMLQSGADITIGFFDFSQTAIFGFLLKNKKNKRIKKLFGDDAIEKLEKLIDERDYNGDSKTKTVFYREFTSEEQSMLRIAKGAEEALKDLPLSEAEKDMIKVPLMEIMKQRGGTIPAEYMLVLGLLQITGARVAQVYML